MEVVASLSQGRTAAAQCGLFTYKFVAIDLNLRNNKYHSVWPISRSEVINLYIRQMLKTGQ